MNVFGIFLVLSVLFVSLLVVNSYAQFAPREHHSLYDVSLQIIIRDSNGNLVAYVEPDLMFIRNVYLTHEFLDSKDDKTTIMIDGKNYEQIQFKKTEYFSEKKQITAYDFHHKDVNIIRFMHDGYISQPGDVLTLSAKIIRTIP